MKVGRLRATLTFRRPYTASFITTLSCGHMDDEIKPGLGSSRINLELDDTPRTNFSSFGLDLK